VTDPEVEDALNARQVPKVDVYGDQLFVVAKTEHPKNDKIICWETCIFVSQQHVITIQNGSVTSHQKLREQFEQAPQLLPHGPDYVVHGILVFMVDCYLPLVKAIKDRVPKIEKHTLISFLERKPIRRIFRLKAGHQDS